MRTARKNKTEAIAAQYEARLPQDTLYWLRFAALFNSRLNASLSPHQWRAEVQEWGIIEYQEALELIGII